MFKNTFQSGFLSILYSIGAKPLQIWDKSVRNGHIKRITDTDIQSSVLEIMGTNVSTTFITCPADPNQTLGIKLPFLVMIIKKVQEEINNSISSNSNTSNNASISKGHISINSNDRKSTSNEKKANNMSHKDKSPSDSFRLTNVIFILNWEII